MPIACFIAPKEPKTMRNSILIPIAALAVLSLSSNAYGLTISGWSVKIGSITVVVDLEGVPNTEIRPSIADAGVIFEDIEYLCKNPRSKNVVPGVAGFATTLSFSGLIPSDDVDGRGTATVDFFEKDPFKDALFEPCKRNWTEIVKGSAAAKTVILDLSAFTCAGLLRNKNTIDEACYLDPDKQNEWILGDKTAAVKVTCTVTDILRDRNTGLPLEQEYECAENLPPSN